MAHAWNPAAVIGLAGLAGWLAGNAATFQSPSGGGPPPQETPERGAAQSDAASESMILVKSSEMPVGVLRAIDTDQPPARSVAVETYLDWDSGMMTLVTETGSVSSMPVPSNWEFRHLEPNGTGMISLCFQPGSGLSYLLKEDMTWEPIEEPGEELVIGSYDVHIAQDEDTFYAMRYDLYSGRSWMLVDGVWEPISGNLRDWPDEKPTPVPR